MNVEGLYRIVIDDLEGTAFNKSEHFKKGQKVYGLTVPEIEKISKSFVSQFKVLNLEERFELSILFYKSKSLAQTNFGLKLLQISIEDLKPDHFPILDEISGYLTDWGPTDSFSLYIMQPLLRKYTNETKNLLKKWNNSDFTWKKRASLVTFTRKIGAEGEFVDFLLELCDNLIWDKEDLVRKAIGWALKDNMIGKNKKRLINYVKNLRKIGVSSTTTLYAIRKLKDKEREEVLKIKHSN
ncbi:MAG: DNA alkylation repair protein [Candidatus Hermodarchaeota archaeon]